jgi:hypothetical protein
MGMSGSASFQRVMKSIPGCFRIGDQTLKIVRSDPRNLSRTKWVDPRTAKLRRQV